MNSIDTTDYLSYSRAFIFINDKWDFTRKYILKERLDEDEKNKFKRMHRIIELSYINEDKLISKDNIQKYATKQLLTFYTEKSDLYVLTPAESIFLSKFKEWINFEYNKDIKRCLENKIFSKTLADHDLKIRGELDCLDGAMILDFKGETISSLKFKKLKYAIQQVVYNQLFKNKTQKDVKFYFLSLPLSHPFSFSRFTFPDTWIEGVHRLFFNKILPQYDEYKSKVKDILGEDIFTRKIENKGEVLNMLVNNQLLSVDFELTPSAYEYKDLDLMMTDNIHKVDFYRSTDG